MSLNKYQWELYLKAGGQDVVDKFRKFMDEDFDGYPDFVAELVAKFSPDSDVVEWNRYIAQRAIDALNDVKTKIIDNQDDSDELTDEEEMMLPAEYCSELWQDYKEELCIQKGKWNGGAVETILEDLIFYSHVWSIALGDRMFIPYLFQRSFNVLCAIADTFDIQLPPVPGKTQYEQRCRFLGELCSVLNDFADENNLSDEELWAFLYDYAPSCIGGKDWVWNELPEPHNVFVFGYGPEYPEENPESLWIAQGNPEMQPGDIGLLYHWVPDRCYTSIWCAMAPGFYDPLFTHDRCVCYGKPIIIPRITYADLKADPIFSQTSLVKTNMQHMDGAPMLPSEYMHLLDMCAQKGTVSNNIFRFKLAEANEDMDLKVEHDVELQLLEPLLRKLGWTPENWLTQMSVRVGRGEHKRPDYVINPVTTRNKERGEIVFEAKLTIPNKKQLETDKGQARSYAKLLSARVCALVAKEGIWLMQATDNYEHDDFYSWADLKNADTFAMVYQMVGKRIANMQKKTAVK